MKAIITDNLSIAQDIARIVRATNRKDGYMTGNGYMVTWALGHLISPVMPEKYNYKHYVASDLPIISEPLQLIVKQLKTDKGYKPDIAALKQLNVIDFVFSLCESIIVATAPSADGELIFRNIYQHLGYTKPFQRLWLSSLTDEGIRKGLDNLKEGKELDGLYNSAMCREKADWLTSINANRALAVSVGRFENSLGRLQTPVLSMICSRFRENRDFTPSDYWKLHVTMMICQHSQKVFTLYCVI